MTTKINKLLLATGLLAPALAHADCADLMPKWGALYAKGREMHESHATCKVWPANPALTLAAMPYQQPDATDDAGVDDLLLVVADSQSGAVIAHLMQPSAIDYDGMRLSAIALDTARYQVAPGQRAFGVRIEHAAGRSTQYVETALNLYVVEGTKVRPILTQLAVGSANREWDGTCAGTLTEMSRAISVGAPGEGGYVALQVAEQSKETAAMASGAQCVEKVGAARRKAYTLTYRGGQYAVPKAISRAQ